MPGTGPEDLIAELRRLVGTDLEIEASNYMPGPAEPDMSLFPVLAETLQRADPSGTPVPLCVSGTTDARFFTRLGIQTYGYLPWPLPPDVSAPAMVHNADERIPVESVAFGADVIYEVLRAYSTTS